MSPLKKGKSKETIKKNIKELIMSAPSPARAKGIHTLAQRQGLTVAQANRKMAAAIAYAKAKGK